MTASRVHVAVHRRCTPSLPTGKAGCRPRGAYAAMVAMHRGRPCHPEPNGARARQRIGGDGMAEQGTQHWWSDALNDPWRDPESAPAIVVPAQPEPEPQPPY